MAEKNIAAITHEACPICGKPDAHSQIIIHKHLRDMSDYHGKTTGYGQPCEECQKGFDMDGVWIIVIDLTKTKNPNDINDWYRTGNIFCVKKSMIKKLLKGNKDMLADVLKKQAMVMGVEDAKSIGLPVKYGEEQ